MVKQSKVDAVEKLVKNFSDAKSVVITDYRGLTVGDITILRNNFRAEKVEYRVVKNRLAKIALQKAGCDPLDDILVGPTAIAFGYDDPVPAARVIYDFSKKNELLKPKGGLLEGKRIQLETLEKLSQLPPKEELLGRLVGSIQSPSTKIAICIKQVATNLVYAMKALAEQKQGAESS